MSVEAGLQSEEITEQTAEAARSRSYVVLQESSLVDVVRELLARVDVGLSGEEWERLTSATDAKVYREIERVDSRNSAHALTQVGARYEAGQTPPLVAVSARMFQPRRVNVSFNPQVSIA